MFSALILPLCLSPNVIINTAVTAGLVSCIGIQWHRTGQKKNGFSGAIVVVAELGISFGLSSAIALGLVILGVPSRSVNYDAGMWTYGFAFAFAGIPCLLAGLLLRLVFSKNS